MAKHHRAAKKKQEQKRRRRAKRVAAELANDQAGQASLAELQQRVGNRAVQRLLRSGAIQAKPFSEQMTPLVQREGEEEKATTFDMGSPVSNAKEIFYSISEPNLAKVPKKFKFTDKDGNKLAGETRWEIGAECKFTKKGKQWVVDPIPWTIKSMDVELPQWQNFSTANHAAKKEWARFIKCTRIHEQGHVKRTRQFVSTGIPEKWKSARASTRKNLVSKLKSLTTLVKNKAQQISDAYDTKTGHGATQGATLKPPSASP